MHPAKAKYMIECQKAIIEGLDKSIKILTEQADIEMRYTQLSTHSPHYELAIGKLTRARNLAMIKIEILEKALVRQDDGEEGLIAWDQRMDEDEF